MERTWILELTRVDTGSRARVEFTAGEIEGALDNGSSPLEERLQISIERLLPYQVQPRPRTPLYPRLVEARKK
ncbi:MAG: hypothetical protein HY315_05780 [Acidobacteria bacterium]|nr:hypothetical protein [Acidobacteriota bacterium]